MAGCSLSFGTYWFAENRDIKSGIMNTIDLLYVFMILVAILFWGERGTRFKSHEKWYLAAAVGILVYAFATGNAYNSNRLTQILMSLAYIPMFHKLLKEKKKTDSYFGWIPAAFNALVALYPALHEGNDLAVLYAVRAFIFTLITSIMMAYYQFRTRHGTVPLKGGFHDPRTGA